MGKVLRELCKEYISRASSEALEAIREWLAVEQWGSKEGEDFIDGVEVGMVELRDGHIGEAELRAYLGDILRTK